MATVIQDILNNGRAINDELGKKLLISGGGRCNLTNANPNQREFVAKFGKKGNFLLYS